MCLKAIKKGNLENAKPDLATTNQNLAFKWPDNLQNELAFVIQEAFANATRYNHGDLIRIDFNEDQKNI